LNPPGFVAPVFQPASRADWKVGVTWKDELHLLPRHRGSCFHPKREGPMAKKKKAWETQAFVIG